MEQRLLVLVADTFTKSLGALDGKARAAVKCAAFDFQLNPARPGHRFHRLVHPHDHRFWSLRVDRDLRLIVHRGESGLLLCYAGHHDEAYAWAEHRWVAPAAAPGVVEVAVVVMRAVEAHRSTEAPPSSPDHLPSSQLPRGSQPAPARGDSPRRDRLRRRAVAPLTAARPSSRQGSDAAGAAEPLRELLRVARMVGRGAAPAGARSSVASARDGSGKIFAAERWTSSLRRGALWAGAFSCWTAAVVTAVAEASWVSNGRAVAPLAGAAVATLITVGQVAVRRVWRHSVDVLLGEVGRARDALHRGQTRARVDAARVDFELRPLAASLNEALDAITQPFERTTEALTRLAAGELPNDPGASAEGDYQRQGEALDALVAFLRMRSEEIEMLVARGVGARPADAGSKPRT